MRIKQMLDHWIGASCHFVHHEVSGMVEHQPILFVLSIIGAHVASKSEEQLKSGPHA